MRPGEPEAALTARIVGAFALVTAPLIAAVARWCYGDDPAFRGLSYWRILVCVYEDAFELTLKGD